MYFCSVLEMRVESAMSWMEPEKFVDMYLAGRSKKKGKKERTVMALDHVRLLIRRLYKRPGKKVCPRDRRFLLH